MEEEKRLLRTALTGGCSKLEFARIATQGNALVNLVMTALTAGHIVVAEN
ncbi:OLC1v1012153C1 [Oldenlandia corymbosa var. corymbosa]|uniref:OLC1v1012153C1 n=1 Tax=Oldenlandia corymbosa var. corymbosa TaxID=529605 RepID=A0AAV1DVG5_OLDCO|nr:OLC1v1012153C1 [Oldenlandia corymbosa var. corymbosa]